jgi:hypothetical protein
MSQSIIEGNPVGSAWMELDDEMFHTPKLHLFLSVEEVGFGLVLFKLFDGTRSLRNVFEVMLVALTVLGMFDIFFVVFD